MLADDAGELWLLDHDPLFKPTRDFNRKERAIGLADDLMRATVRGGRLVEHGGHAAERLCARCSKPFAPRKSDHQYCGDLCRAHARREYQRDLMRVRRAA